jgi:hypothetical protein
MNSSNWTKINDFKSLGEFNLFILWLNVQVDNGQAFEVPVQSPYIGNSTFTEKWFKELGSETVWRVVWPDFPFTGLFEPVGFPN